ncbi:hypothetical protein, conserved [Leishmania tarentolae]|uniref:Uncharacterized protein n=1 Tax=Leishmania tarentolae TaxID=5689 RepID=A0A640KT67_LEITA|nr:hypothetical protein, conserved [Leishmania tarentolae]
MSFFSCVNPRFGFGRVASRSASCGPTFWRGSRSLRHPALASSPSVLPAFVTVASSFSQERQGQGCRSFAPPVLLLRRLPRHPSHGHWHQRQRSRPSLVLHSAVPSLGQPRPPVSEIAAHCGVQALAAHALPFASARSCGEPASSPSASAFAPASSSLRQRAANTEVNLFWCVVLLREWKGHRASLPNTRSARQQIHCAK